MERLAITDRSCLAAMRSAISSVWHNISDLLLAMQFHHFKNEAGCWSPVASRPPAGVSNSVIGRSGALLRARVDRARDLASRISLLSV